MRNKKNTVWRRFVWNQLKQMDLQTSKKAAFEIAETLKQDTEV